MTREGTEETREHEGGDGDLASLTTIVRWPEEEEEEASTDGREGRERALLTQSVFAQPLLLLLPKAKLTEGQALPPHRLSKERGGGNACGRP